DRRREKPERGARGHPRGHPRGRPGRRHRGATSRDAAGPSGGGRFRRDRGGGPRPGSGQGSRVGSGRGPDPDRHTTQPPQGAGRYGRLRRPGEDRYGLRGGVGPASEVQEARAPFQEVYGARRGQRGPRWGHGQDHRDPSDLGAQALAAGQHRVEGRV
ncbi:MAG: SSU ribosomal protein S17p (S11e), partial [uncultured Rubrobacteraceae bacterium]